MKKYWWIVVLAAVIVLTVILISPQPTVMTAGDLTLDNTDFAYYYWSEFFYFKEAYGEYLTGTVDFSQPLDRQPYDETMTWQDHLTEETIEVAADTLSMVIAAQKAGFGMPDEYELSLAETWSGFVDQSGGDVSAYLRNSYGRHADQESFYTYLDHCHLAAAYAEHLYLALDPTAAEVDKYLKNHMGEYMDAGITDPTEQAVQAREDLILELHGEQMRQIRAEADVQINPRAIRIRAPKGLYE